MKFSIYSKTLPLAKEIYLKLYGIPETSIEIANMYNKVGDINEIIIKNEDTVN